MDIRSRTTTRPGATTRRAVVLGVCLALVGLLGGGAVAAAGPQFTPGNAESEVMRLLNGERTQHGLPTLAIDPFLQWVARDGPVECTNGGATMEGRAKDMAISGELNPFHQLRTCGVDSYGNKDDILDALYLWGYRPMYAENIAMTGGYDYHSVSYQFGCDVTEQTCTGSMTTAPSTVERAARAWMASQGHRDAALSTVYDRFGCGVWQAPGPVSDFYYACLYASGPGTREAPPPTPTPDPTPTPTPTPEPTPAWDETVPLITGFAAPVVATARNRSFTTTWSATDNDVISQYVVWIQKGTGTWSEQPAQTGTTKTFSGLSPGTWHVGVRAVDAAGNWSAFRQATVLVPTDDRAWRFSAGTTRRADSHYVNGTDTTTRRTGAKMTIRFTGSSFILLGTTAKSHGKLRVTIDGRSYTVDEGYHLGARATSTHYRVTLLNKTLTRRAHTVVITNLGTAGRPTIDVDGAAWRY
jgi:uncharacterized protein YkwD